MTVNCPPGGLRTGTSGSVAHTFRSLSAKPWHINYLVEASTPTVSVGHPPSRSIPHYVLARPRTRRLLLSEAGITEGPETLLNCTGQSGSRSSGAASLRVSGNAESVLNGRSVDFDDAHLSIPLG